MTKQDFLQWKEQPETQEFFQKWRERKQEYLEQMPGLVNDHILLAKVAGGVDTINAFLDTKWEDE